MLDQVIIGERETKYASISFPGSHALSIRGNEFEKKFDSYLDKGFQWKDEEADGYEVEVPKVDHDSALNMQFSVMNNLPHNAEFCMQFSLVCRDDFSIHQLDPVQFSMVGHEFITCSIANGYEPLIRYLNELSEGNYELVIQMNRVDHSDTPEFIQNIYFEIVDPFEARTETLTSLVENYDLAPGLTQSLTLKLAKAIESNDKGILFCTLHKLNAFINEVNALTGKDQIPEEVGARLIQRVYELTEYLSLYKIDDVNREL